ncbi:MAG: GNAT family N-acetyltransferase [Candidatus Thorarchaeota archaeon]
MDNETLNNKMEIIDEMSAKDWQFISTNLRDFNIEQSGGLSVKPGTNIHLTLKHKNGEVVGGLRGRMYYLSLTIDHLWIDERFRKRGYGKQLLLNAEGLAKEEGCASANTSSYSFQAPKFYEKLGYKTVGVFEGYPEGIKRFFLEKRL